MKKLWIFIFVLVIFFGLVFYYSKDSYDQNKEPYLLSNSDESKTESMVPTIYPEKVENSGSGFYQNELGKFSLEYPKGMTVSSYKESSDSYSIIFEEKDNKKSFQIFFTPYTEKSISKERFLMDVPSGVMKEKIDIVIDGTPASMFFSENNLMGETREVWFIKNGYLFEVVTYKSLDLWLAQIMDTWKFITK